MMTNITITTIEELDNLVTGVYGYGTSADELEVVLANDLDFAELPDTDSRKFSFNGSDQATATWYMTFDGGGNEIKNLSYSGADFFGLFGTVNGDIKNVTLKDINITTADEARTIAYRMNGEMYNCHILGAVNADSTCLGLCGLGTNGKVQACSFSGTLSGGNGSSGIAVAGSTTTGTSNSISMCHFNGTLRIKSGSGYAIGRAKSVEHCYFRGSMPLNNSDGWANNFGGASGLSGSAKYCYMILNNAAELQTAGITARALFYGTPTSCWYNNDTYAYGTTGGTTETNIKNAAWLAQQGWPITI